MSTEERREVKKKLRREVLARRAALTEPERERGNLLITERILGHQWYYLSDTILGFVSYGSEICTTEILENALQDGKRVYVPKVEGQEMRFYRIQSLAELKEGYKGILEPEGNTESYEYAPEEAANCLLLMPGSVFDPLGNRMGYGGGFYDRYLADREALRLRSIAVGFRCQQVESVHPIVTFRQEVMFPLNLNKSGRHHRNSGFFCHLIIYHFHLREWKVIPFSKFQDVVGITFR